MITDRPQDDALDPLALPLTSRQGVAWGKAMLFGEYAVLQGSSALLSVTQHQARAEYQPLSTLLKDHVQSPDSSWSQMTRMYQEMTSEDLTVLYVVNAGPLGQMFVGIRRGLTSQVDLTSDLDVDVDALIYSGAKLPFAAAVLHRLKAPWGIYHIDTSNFGVIRSGKWEKMGIGSSGASTAALIDLLAKLPHQMTEDLSTAQLRFEVACDIHHQVQGRLGSGADIAMSTYGGLIRVQGPPHRVITPLKTRLPNTWGLWSGGSASTIKAVKRVRAWATQDRQAYEVCMEHLSEAEQNAYLALSSRDPQRAWCTALKRGADAARALGERAGVSIWTSRHQRWSELVAPLGGVIKSSGAGGDDLSLFTAQDPEAERRCLDALTHDAQVHEEDLKYFKLG